jgi:GNAT superfamily N-acetyltransferase
MIRAAAVEDVPQILAMIRELAAYERAPDAAVATPEQIGAALFGEAPAAFALMAEDDEGQVVGFALWFLNFSTWTGIQGMHLEDLYVRPHARGGGHGRALLSALAQVCETRGYQRMEWAVLDWNEPSIGFYKALGAEPLDEWTTFRLSGSALSSVAGSRSN